MMSMSVNLIHPLQEKNKPSIIIQVAPSHFSGSNPSYEIKFVLRIVLSYYSPIPYILLNQALETMGIDRTSTLIEEVLCHLLFGME